MGCTSICVTRGDTIMRVYLLRYFGLTRSHMSKMIPIIGKSLQLHTETLIKYRIA